ncbi:hypothetical protein NT6N_27260 [Oceaniferula spumae]|uniref:Uncharacterized protein n=1 Tax=Oceaniferula spumae TaxID=2979115 RepID=A0AAT9FNW5_9BACT
MSHALTIAILGLAAGVFQWLSPVMTTPNKETADQLPWPETFEGYLLTPLPMTAMEREFQRSFPGQIGNFRSGENQIILRRVTRATRKLHPATDCLKASGHRIGKASLYTDHQGGKWSGCEVSKAGQTFFVRECITSPNGKIWTDVSSWYWHAMMHPDSGPWLASTIISTSQY